MKGKKTYTFSYEWGETWEVTAENFEGHLEYWSEVIARNLYYYRTHTTNDVDIITWCAIDRVVDGDKIYMGTISVGKHSGYMIFRDNGNEINKEIESECYQ